MLELEINTGPEPETVDRELYIVSLENIITSQRRELEILRSCVDKFAQLPPGPRTLAHFLWKLSSRDNLGRMYGWKTALIKASQATGCREIDLTMIQQWQRANQVPVWAYHQIDLMQFDPVPRRPRKPVWSVADKRYLADQHMQNPKAPDANLAKLCTKKFGRTITESAIKGALCRLRRDDVVPAYKGRGHQ